MSVFKYCIGNVYIVYHDKKGLWNTKRKKYTDSYRGATWYKNKKCAENKAKQVGRGHKVLALQVMLPNWW